MYFVGLGLFWQNLNIRKWIINPSIFPSNNKRSFNVYTTKRLRIMPVCLSFFGKVELNIDCISIQPCTVWCKDEVDTFLENLSWGWSLLDAKIKRNLHLPQNGPLWTKILVSHWVACVDEVQNAILLIVTWSVNPLWKQVAFLQKGMLEQYTSAPLSRPCHADHTQSACIAAKFVLYSPS